MSLSKKSLKRRNYASKATHLLILSAARRMNETASEYNATFQQRMSSKHHPEQVYRDAVKLVTTELWMRYRKARTTFFNLRRKHGVEFTNRILRNMDTRPARNAVLRELLDPKPGLVRKQICGTAKRFTGRAVLPETVDAAKVGEMDFEQATILFKRQLVEELVKSHGIVVGNAVNMVEDYGNNKDLLLKVLNELIEKEELKFYFARHKVLPSDTPFNVTKITDI
ncbi:hypothetical protein pEaSNUABM37_00231 [Erwinia phage pEa_SNUABM_37]|nr:hypothetical protein pEaSNUABM37_00231 [Erwinia phage pEa_SNUABM_37]QXO10699.1 hypothetical protein pEaSNUABM48_00231 [Erwinia phage pEa_SNUABM_48]